MTMDNKNKVLKAIYLADYVPDVMEKIEESLLGDKDIIEYAVRVDGCALEYASDNLKNDNSILHYFSPYLGVCHMKCTRKSLTLTCYNEKLKKEYQYTIKK